MGGKSRINPDISKLLDPKGRGFRGRVVSRACIYRIHICEAL